MAGYIKIEADNGEEEKEERKKKKENKKKFWIEKKKKNNKAGFLALFDLDSDVCSTDGDMAWFCSLQ